MCCYANLKLTEEIRKLDKEIWVYKVVKIDYSQIPEEITSPIKDWFKWKPGITRVTKLKRPSVEGERISQGIHTFRTVQQVKKSHTFMSCPHGRILRLKVHTKDLIGVGFQDGFKHYVWCKVKLSKEDYNKCLMS